MPTPRLGTKGAKGPKRGAKVSYAWSSMVKGRSLRRSGLDAPLGLVRLFVPTRATLRAPSFYIYEGDTYEVWGAFCPGSDTLFRIDLVCRNLEQRLVHSSVQETTRSG